MDHFKEILVKISLLLKESEEIEWEKTFSFFLTEINNNSDEVIKRNIRSIYGGMGSFNDLVLHRDGKINGSFNNQLDDLRSKLFDIIK